MAATRRVTIQDLPPEILSGVVAFLDRPAPSEGRLHEQPSEDMLDADVESQHLKAASLVSKTWRSVVLPLLFRNVIWRPRISSLTTFGLRPVPLLQFLLDNRLDHYVTTFTLHVNFEEKEIIATEIHQHIRPADLEWLWDQLFSVIDPLRFTLLAPPTTLAAFLNRMLFLDDAWSFGIPYHILSLARSSRDRTPEQVVEVFDSDESQLSALHLHSTVEAATSSSAAASSSSETRTRPPTAPPCALFTLRPWTSILLNEGSSARAYQTYEFFLRSPPSMLSALLGFGEFPNDTPLLPSSVTDFNYIAIFPLSSHFQSLLSHLPPLDRLFVQLTPRPGNRILEDREAMKLIEMADLWMERATSISNLFIELTAQSPRENWARLKVFETGDDADKESWSIAATFVAGSRVNWRSQREGVLVRVDEEGNVEIPRGAVAQHLLSEEQPLEDRPLLPEDLPVQS